jgi:2-phospho-L-lactate guanylyltransferase
VRTAAILPVKRFDRAKQRLSASVTDELRRELAGAMVADVLDALARARTIERTIVVTREQSVASGALERGAIVVEDHAEAGQPAAAALGIRRALDEGIERVLCVPGDCPALDPHELDALLGAHEHAERPPHVVILPDRHGSGTNGLLLAPPDAISPSFGPDSAHRHRALANAAGVLWAIERLPSLLLDIDTGADLNTLRRRLSAQSARAPRTHAVLAHDERTPILSLETPACLSP